MLILAILLQSTPAPVASAISPQPAVDLQACITRTLAKRGLVNVVPIDRGVSIDWNLKQIIAVPGHRLLSFEVEDRGEDREIRLYGFKSWKGKPARGFWKEVAARCYPVEAGVEPKS